MISENKRTRISNAESDRENNLKGYPETHSEVWKSFYNEIPESIINKLNAEEVNIVCYAMQKQYERGRADEWEELNETFDLESFAESYAER